MREEIFKKLINKFLRVTKSRKMQYNKSEKYSSIANTVNDC